MKRCFLPLIALALLPSACSSLSSVQVRHSAPPPPIPAGTKVTVWGELPTYDQKGHYFRELRAPDIAMPGLVGAVTIDLLINHDGSVQDGSVFESSGHAVLDRAALSRFRKARYTLQLEPTDPAPYVVRLLVVMKSNPSNTAGGIDPSQHKNLGGPTGPTQGYSTAGP